MLSDAQWSELEPLVEACRPKAKTPPQDLRRTLSAILWRHQNGAKWRAIPEDLGPWWRAAQIFIRWSRAGVWERLLGLVQERGVQLGMVFLDGITCDPLRYVLPALSSDGVHAAWYSDTLAPEGPTRIIRATASVGAREEQPFLHCHGLWQTGTAPVAMGHLLPLESLVAADCRVTGIGSREAWFDSLPDAETAFTLFQVAGGGVGSGLGFGRSGSGVGGASIFEPGVERETACGRPEIPTHLSCRRPLSCRRTASRRARRSGRRGR